MEKNTIKPKKDNAFGKEVYLLGSDQDGIFYWLEAPKWDCGWYWGFGYVETYQKNRKPSKAKDIDSHRHIDSSFLGVQEIYDTEKQVWKKGEYIHNIYDSPKFVNTTFDEKTGWILSELFQRFYTLIKSAEMFGRGGCHTTTYESFSLKKEDWSKEINEKLIPEITAEIIRLLSPKTAN
jgi:hypothetical protein